jgi:hypothetical protein
MERNGQKTINQAQSPKEEREAQPIWSSNLGLSGQDSKAIQKEEGKWLPWKSHFSLLSWHGA